MLLGSPNGVLGCVNSEKWKEAKDAEHPIYGLLFKTHQDGFKTK
jgi:hypothetical protein